MSKNRNFNSGFKKEVKHEPLDIVFHNSYKNAEMEVVIEDDVITMARIFMDGECTFCGEVENSAYPNGMPWEKFRDVYEVLKKEIDKELAEDGREEATNMALVGR